jgi:hypothetical protein
MMSRLPLIAGMTAAIAAAAAAQFGGPDSSAACHVVPNAALKPGSVSTVSILTTGDSIGGYRYVGIPDGLGAFSDGGVATALINHELGASQGVVRAHGSKGAFVSRFTFDPTTLQVFSGRDHAQQASDVYVYDRLNHVWNAGTFAWDRFCSSDLAAETAYAFGGLGTTARLYLTGEETRPPFASRHGSAWAFVATGPGADQVWELPHLGQCSFENIVASPHPQTKTVVFCLDDSDAQTNPALTTQPSELYVYVGNKQATGNDVEKAGLVGGTLYGIRVSTAAGVVPAESNLNGFGTSSYLGSATFEMVALGDASTFNGAAQQTASIANDVTRFQRVEDGAFDPRPGFEDDFYFVTTASGSTNSRLFRVRFTDVEQPELGGTIEILLVGNEGQSTLDNMCVDGHGRVLMQEDPGSATRLAKTWLYDLENGKLVEVAAYDAALFTPGMPGFVTTNEEASGVVPAFDLLGDGWYLCTSQVHATSADPELVEGGQFFAMYVDPKLGREFDLWFSSPSGAGSAQMHHMFGKPSATYFTAVSLNAGLFPNGAFYGVDIAFGDLINQALFGDPFVGVLDATGKKSGTIFTALPSGLAFYSVAIDDVLGLTPKVSAPVAYTIP